MELISDPNRFFEKLAEKEVKLLKPVLAVILPMSILGGIYQYVISMKLAEAFVGDVAFVFKLVAYLGVVFALITSFVSWLILTLIMFALSALFGGEGSFRKTLESVGYGFFPFLISSLIKTPLTVKYALEAELPKISMNTIKENPEAVDLVVKSLLPSEVIYSSAVINVAATVWAVVMWSFALKHSRNLEFRKAFVSASLPAVLYTAYQLWTLLRLL